MTRRVQFLTPTGAMRMWSAVVTTIVALAAAVVLSIGYTAARQRESDQRWCALLSTLIVPQPTTPPQTPQEARGRRVTEQIRQLHRELGCDRS